MRISRYLVDSSRVPVDFCADPDGFCPDAAHEDDFERLVEAAGFDPKASGVMIGALSEPFEGYLDGAAVVMQEGAPYLAVVQWAPAVSVQLAPAQPAPMQLAAQAAPTLPVVVPLVAPTQEPATRQAA